MRKYEVTLLDGRKIKVKALSRYEAIFEANMRHLVVREIKDITDRIPPNPVGFAGES